MTQEEVQKLMEIMKAAQQPETPGPAPVGQQPAARAPAATPQQAAPAPTAPPPSPTAPISPVAAMQQDIRGQAAAHPEQFYPGAHATGGQYAAQGFGSVPVQQGFVGPSQWVDNQIDRITPTYDPNASFAPQFVKAIPSGLARLAKGLVVDAPYEAGEAVGDVAMSPFREGMGSADYRRVGQALLPLAAMAVAGPAGRALASGGMPLAGAVIRGAGMMAPMARQYGDVAMQAQEQGSLEPVKRALVEHNDLALAPIAPHLMDAGGRVMDSARGMIRPSDAVPFEPDYAGASDRLRSLNPNRPGFDAAWRGEAPQPADLSPEEWSPPGSINRSGLEPRPGARGPNTATLTRAEVPGEAGAVPPPISASEVDRMSSGSARVTPEDAADRAPVVRAGEANQVPIGDDGAPVSLEKKSPAASQESEEALRSQTTGDLQKVIEEERERSPEEAYRQLRPLADSPRFRLRAATPLNEDVSPEPLPMSPGRRSKKRSRRE